MTTRNIALAVVGLAVALVALATPVAVFPPAARAQQFYYWGNIQECWAADNNDDGAVDVIDNQRAAAHYGAVIGNPAPSWPRYDPLFDIEPFIASNGDGDIDVKDLQKVFGRNGAWCSDIRLDGAYTDQVQQQTVGRYSYGDASTYCTTDTGIVDPISIVVHLDQHAA